ncbi:MAG: NemA3 [Deltaproteobacteria bacterium]|nr:NemA3 [Deltaproteobacteria bacterium]
MSPFQKLFTPWRIGKLELKNRIVMPPMATNFADLEGSVNERHIAYYRRRARGGAGLIIFEHTGIAKQGKAFANMALIDSDAKISQFKKLARTVHEEGGKFFIQINHAGRQTTSAFTGGPLVAPSPIPCPVRREMPKALSQKEIYELVQAYAKAAVRAKESGADGVEIHMAHGYLLNQFLSPFSNRREDEYGGSLERRLKMPLDVLRAVRNKVGADFPVTCRFSADEYVEGGLRIEDSKQIARNLEEHGADGQVRRSDSGNHSWPNPDSRFGRPNHKGKQGGFRRHGSGLDRRPGTAPKSGAGSSHGNHSLHLLQSLRLEHSQGRSAMCR